MKLGILGYPKTGKTTVFNALTGADIPTDAFGRGGKSNLGLAKVRDERLAVLAGIYEPKKITPATVEYIDVPGLTPGEGKNSAYLGEFRPVDALLHVIRVFEDEGLPHVFEGLDPARDAAAMEEELLLADLAAIETRLEKISNDLKRKKDEELVAEAAVLSSMQELLENEQSLRSKDWPEEDLARVRGMALLSLKPILHVLNLGDEAAGEDPLGGFDLSGVGEGERTGLTHLLGRVEAEIAQLDAEDAAEFLKDMGLTEPTADRVAAASYALLDLISFLTGGEMEVRAWPIRRGSTARKAAGTIHSDIARGFIRAELVAYDALVQAGSWAKARDTGDLRLEGKEYIVADGDVILFRFNV